MDQEKLNSQGTRALATLLDPTAGPDGEVDVLDIATIAKRYGCNKDYPCYVPHYGLDYDDKIDILDIATVAIHFSDGL